MMDSKRGGKNPRLILGHITERKSIIRCPRVRKQPPTKVDGPLERSKMPRRCPVEPLMSDRTVISVAKGPRRVARRLWYLLPVAAATAAGVFQVFSFHRHARQPAAISTVATNQPANVAADSPYDSPEARARLWEQLRQLQA